MSAAGVSAISAAPAPAAHSAIDIAALQHKIAELEEEIKQVKARSKKAEDNGDTEMVKLLLKDKTALQEEKNLLLKSQSDAAPPRAMHAATPAGVAPVFVDVHRWDSEEVRNVRLSASSGIESLDPAVRAAFNVPADQVCKIYYLTDPQRPRQTKQKVHDSQSWQEFWSLRSASAEHIGFHLHVTPRAAPGSPEKEPSWLKIDTGVKRASQRPGGTPSSAAAATGATPSGSPGDVQTPRSPLLRDSTLHRDFDEEKDLSYCVFCGICYDAGPQLEAAHLIPNAASERFDLAVSEDLLGMIGGYYETTLNAVAACRLCHPLFDDGLLWLQPPAAGSSTVASLAASAGAPVTVSSLVMYVDASQKSDHSRSLAGRSLRLPGPTRAHLPFPPAAAWEWRMRWAPLKRQDELAKAMGQLGVSGPCESKDACRSKKKQRNKNCTRRMCEPCCRAAPSDAIHCKEHKPATPKSAR